jgi:hypothetical protein
MKYCILCSDEINPARYGLGYKLCLNCGDKRAKEVKHCIVPLAKSNYQPVTNSETLKQLNKYAHS